MLSCLAVARYYDDDPEGRLAMTGEAFALARPVADDVSLAHLLHLRAMALYSPDYPEQCLRATAELIELPDVAPPLVAAARLIRTDCLQMYGRMQKAATELDLATSIAEQMCSQPLRTQVAWARAGLMLLAGRWQQADQLSQAAYQLHLRVSWIGARLLRLVQRWEAAYLTGSGVDLIDELRAEAQTLDIPVLHNILAIALARAGRMPEARAARERGVAANRRDYGWLYTQCWSLVAAVRLGETERVRRLRVELLPYRHLICVLGATAVINGSVAYFAAEAALALGDGEAALADLAIATEMNERIGARPWLTQARQAITRAQRLRQASS